MKRLVAGRRAWAKVAALAAAVAAAVAVPSCRPSTSPAPAPAPAPAPQTPPPCSIQLHNVSDESGIDWLHTDGSSGRRYILEAMSAGLATFDYDGDGLIDVYFPNGAPLQGTKVDRPPRHALYKNLGNFKFREVTDEAGVVSTRFGLGIAIGDYDNDGWPDLYLDNFGPNVLFRNNGDGSFTDASDRAGVRRGSEKAVGAGACFLDVDGDGHLDLYVGNYIDFSYEVHVPHVVDGLPSYPSPRDYAPVPDTLYRNNGDGTFSDSSVSSGIARRAGRSMGMVCADFDSDGHTDVFICNDVMENFLFHNDGTGKFEEVGLTVGTAFNCFGETMANMAADAGDYDNDGWLDLFVTNYQGQWPILFRNLGGGLFEDVSPRTGAGAGGYAYVNWGCGLVDLDNDGHKDIFFGNGHTEDNIDLRDKTTSYKSPNTLLKNLGNGTFANVSDQAGDGLLPRHVARGVAFDDLDNDGDLDVLILNSREKPTVLRNMFYELGGKAHWLQLRLVGVKTNRDGVGARVVVTAGNLIQIDEVHSGRGYQSHWGSRLHFGLGSRDRVDRIEIRWIGGGGDVFENVSVDRLITLTEGTGRRTP